MLLSPRCGGSSGVSNFTGTSSSTPCTRQQAQLACNRILHRPHQRAMAAFRDTTHCSRTWAGDLRSPRRGASQPVTAVQDPNPTIRKRIKHLRQDADRKLKNAWRSFLQLPALQPLLRWLAQLTAAIDVATQPARHRVKATTYAVTDLWEQEVERFDSFCMDETKRKWKWSRENDVEMRFWKATHWYTMVFIVTVAYQALVPVSWVLALALPLWVGRCQFPRNVWLNPIATASLGMAIFKFIPGANLRLVF